MTDKDTLPASSQAGASTSGSSALLVFEFSPPLNTTLSADAQVDALLADSRLSYCNAAASALLGDVALGTTLADIAARSVSAKTMEEEYRSHLRGLVNAGYQLEGQGNTGESGGRQVFYTSRYFGEQHHARLHRLIVIYQAEPPGLHQDKIVARLSRTLAPHGGDALLRSLVVNFSLLMGIRYALVGQIVRRRSGTWVSTRAFSERGRLRDNADYLLQGTPGEQVGEGEICLYAAQAQQRFPNDRMLAAMGIQSYIGVPLVDADGQVHGLLALLHDEPMQEPHAIRNILLSFAARAGTELEWLKSLQVRKIGDERQRMFFEKHSSGMCVLEVDPPMPLSLSTRQQVRWLTESSRYVECNAALVSMLGLTRREEVIGRVARDLNVNFDFSGVSQGFVASSYQVSDYVAELVDSAGARRWISFSSSGVIEGERLTTIISVITDISERMRYTQQLEHQASHDELTGLPNRSHFVQRVTDVAENAAAGEQWAVCLLDLDGFKEINDTLGHEMGDHLLKGLATRLGEVVGSQGGLLARVGGDEFALLYQCPGERAVCELVEAVATSIQTPFAVHDLELRIGGSVGIALFPRDGATTSALMRCADIAMYKAKTAGVDYQLYASDQDVYSIRRLSLMMDIRQAIEGDQLLLHYQPVIDFPGQRLVSFEALLRWQHPRHGLLPPGEFIPLIELTDMIESMTWWVLEAAIRQLQAWQARGWDYRVAVNISARNVADDRFAARVAGLLARYGVPARQLELEITESALMADPDKARHVLQQLDSMGVWLSIDDYGTGYSSLAYLKSLPIDTLKIDRSFISNMLQTEQDRIIVNSTIQLAHNLGMSVTAEGIEYAELIDALADLGCDKGQGYYICRPVSPSELPAWVELHQRHRYADTEQF